MLSPNTLLQDRYLIIRSIGQGGMGAVYLAKDERLGNTVALKETFFNDARMRRAFEREARLLAHLRHPALPKVIDHFNEADGEFLVMEFIPGEDLEVLLAQRGRPFDAEVVTQWAHQLLDALEYLHTQKTPILHRDIKPANLKLSTRDQIILLDFGLAKGEAGQMSSVATSRSVLGFTPSFAPLEQIQGTGTDPRSDLYSLGATLYYLMTGIIPANALNRATARVSDLPDPLVPAHQIDPGISPAISDLLSRAVALNPNRRPMTAADMRRELIEAGRTSIPASGEPAKVSLPSTVVTGPAETQTEEDRTLIFNHSEPAKTSLPPPVATQPVEIEREQLRTIPTAPPAAPNLPAASNQVFPTVPANAAVTPTSPMQSSFYAEPAKKSHEKFWLIGGLIALLLIGAVVTIFLRSKTQSAQWEDTESNRRADQAAGVAARVNGKPIMLAEVNDAISRQTEEQQSKLSPTELRQARLQVLDSLIQREVLAQYAEKQNLAPTDDQITTAIIKRQQESQMTDEEFQAKLKEQHMSMEKLREETRKDLAIQALQEKSTNKITITDKEVEDYYNNNRAQFVNKRGVGLSVIVADPANNNLANDAQSDAAAKSKIESIYQQLRNGADFAALARSQSEDASKTKNGDIGFYTEQNLKDGGFPADLITQFFGVMSIGEITAPVATSNGRWSIFKLTQRHLRDENLTLESPGVRAEIGTGLVTQKKEIANAQLLTTAQNEAKIVNYLAASNAP